MTLNMTQAIMRYDALGRLTAIEAGALAAFVYGYAPTEHTIETMTFTHRANSFGYDALDRYFSHRYNVQSVA